MIQVVFATFPKADMITTCSVPESLNPHNCINKISGEYIFSITHENSSVGMLSVLEYSHKTEYS